MKLRRTKKLRHILGHPVDLYYWKMRILWTHVEGH